MTSPSARLRVDVVRCLERHRVMILAYAYAIVRDHHLAEDVHQEVAVIVASDPQRLPADAEGLGRWLRAVTRRKALELGRAARRHCRMLDAELLVDLAGDFGHQEAAAHHARCKEAMTACLRSLRGDAHTVVHARYVEGLDGDRIADRLGRSVQAVYALLKRVRLGLAACVESRLRGEASA